MGSKEPEQVLARAKGTFRGLSAASLTVDDLLSSHDTGLHGKTTLIKLGSCDAFISHSWHDDGTLKFNALGSWVTAFEKDHRRTPIMWLDKASINQDDIENSLACLPVYLAGCKELLILAGPTYCERLWCIVEVFTFLRMGSSPDNMVVVPLAGMAHQLNFGSFDAEHAKCFSAEDKRKLLAAITLAFGSLAPFNAVVRTMLAGRTGRNIEMSAAAAAVGSGTSADGRAVDVPGCRTRAQAQREEEPWRLCARPHAPDAVCKGSAESGRVIDTMRGRVEERKRWCVCVSSVAQHGFGCGVDTFRRCK